MNTNRAGGAAGDSKKQGDFIIKIKSAVVKLLVFFGFIGWSL